MAENMGWTDAACHCGEIQPPNFISLARESLCLTKLYSPTLGQRCAQRQMIRKTIGRESAVYTQSNGLLQCAQEILTCFHSAAEVLGEELL